MWGDHVDMGVLKSLSEGMAVTHLQEYYTQIGIKNDSDLLKQIASFKVTDRG